ncbi:MAG: DUF4114 domain-containing protein [Cyanobacteria bacterium P01_F01_bin.86]
MLAEFKPYETVEVPSHGGLMDDSLGFSFPEITTEPLALSPLPSLDDIDNQEQGLVGDGLVSSHGETQATLAPSPLLGSEPILSTASDPLLGGESWAEAWQMSLEKLEVFTRSSANREAMNLALGRQAPGSQAQNVLDQLLSGQQQPQIEVLPAAVLNAQGAYAAESDTIFLAQELLSQPDQLTRVILEELGHFLDDQINSVDTPGDEGALFAALVMGDRLMLNEIATLQAEDDAALLNWEGQSLRVEHADLEPGLFSVDASGQITVEFVADGGGYESQVALFSLDGMEGLTPGSTDFIQEAARRALTNSVEGYVVIDDAIEKAALSGELGEINRNAGKAIGSKTFTFAPEDSVAVILVPDGSIQEVFDNPYAEGSLRPLFSIAAANPDGQTHIGQIRPGLLAMEDLRFDSGSDGDFNDLIFSLEGATGQVTSVIDLIDSDETWITTPLGKQLFNQTANQPDAESPSETDAELPNDADSQTPENAEPEPPGDANPQPSENSDAFQVSILDDVAKFTGSNDEAQIAASGAASISIDTQTIYIGTNQVSSNNQNPIIASFDSANSANNWIRTDYETTGTDGRGLGLAWDGEDLYAVFSVDGTQGSPSEDFRRVSNDAEQSWLRSYGQGGGAKVSVLGQVDPSTGELLSAAYLSAVLSSGNSNSLIINDLDIATNGNLLVSAESFFSPRRPDGTALTQIGSGGSPFAYTVEIMPDLKRVVATDAPGWV